MNADESVRDATGRSDSADARMRRFIRRGAARQSSTRLAHVVTPLHDRRFFGLLGEVVDGNPTEEMMGAAFHAAGLPWNYVSIPVARDVFPEAFRAADRLGFSGLHITKPFKIEATKMVDRMTPVAEKIGAVNCVYRSDGLVGDNTDGRGLVRALEIVRPVGGASVAVLGSGGAARAVAMELALAGARSVLVVSRANGPGASIAAAIDGGSVAESEHHIWEGTYRVPSRIDVLVDATSVGMADPNERPAVDISQLPGGAVVADVVIAPRPTALLSEAAARGFTIVQGVEMLVKQAAISFELWASRDADEATLRDALDSTLMPAKVDSGR